MDPTLNATHIASTTTTCSSTTPSTNSNDNTNATTDMNAISHQQEHDPLCINDGINNSNNDNNTINYNSISKNETNGIVFGRTRICDANGYRGTIMYVGPVIGGDTKKKNSKSRTGNNSSSKKNSTEQKKYDTFNNDKNDDPNIHTDNYNNDGTFSSQLEEKQHVRQQDVIQKTNDEKQKIYYGIIWDDGHVRGKHNGTITCPKTNQTIQYFTIPKNLLVLSQQQQQLNDDDIVTTDTTTTTTTTTEVKCASFVPIHKVQFGIPFDTNLLLQKYVPIYSKECIAPNNYLLNGTVQISNQRQQNKTKPIEFIGEFHIRQYQQLLLCNNDNNDTNHIHLDDDNRFANNANISNSNNNNEDQNVVSDTTTTKNNNNSKHYYYHNGIISLANYQLSSIDTANVLQWMKQTESTNISTSSTSIMKQTIMNDITEIDVSNNLLTSWNSLFDLVLVLFPNTVQRINIAYNHLYDIVTPPLSLSTYNNINNNPINHRLVHLNVKSTQIQSISTIIMIGMTFSNLQELIISNNNYYYSDNDLVDTSITSLEPHNRSQLSSAQEIAIAMKMANTLAHVLSNVTYLDCSNCFLSYWDETDSVLSHKGSDNMGNNIGNNWNIELMEDNANGNKYLSQRKLRYNLYSLLWSKLPKLQHFSYNQNPNITKFMYPYSNNATSNGCTTTTDTNIYFPSLQHIQFVNNWNCIKTNIDLDHLLSIWDTHIPTLRNIRWNYYSNSSNYSKGTNVNNTNYGISNIRFYILSHCPKVCMINATSVTEQERRDVARQVLISSTYNTEHDNNKKVCRHRNYEYWKIQYPDITSSVMNYLNRNDDTIDSTVRNNSLFHTNFDIITVSIRSMAASSCTKEPIQRQLPTQITIQKVKMLCLRYFYNVDNNNNVPTDSTTTIVSSIGIDQIVLYYRHDDSSSSIPQILSCHDHTLHYYGVPDGAEIYMHEIDDNAASTAINSFEATNKNLRQRQKREIDERVDRLEQEMIDFKLRQQLVTK